MKRLLPLIILLGIAASVTACGATARLAVRDDKAGVDDAEQIPYEKASADEPAWWAYDTPFGY